MCYSNDSNMFGNNSWHLCLVLVRTNSERLLEWPVLPHAENDRHSSAANTPSFLVTIYTTLTKKESFHEEIKSGLKSGKASHHSVQNLLSYCLLSKHMNIKIYRTVTLRTLLYGYKASSLTMWGNIG